MAVSNPKIGGDRPIIRQLDDAAINRIAAGEVVERPASAVKELVENALDAGAQRITVEYADGGKTLIRVSDDGYGIAPDELPLAVSRHATSKIDGSDLLNISSFGFRGEALPSLGAVSRLTIASKAPGFDAQEITVTGGQTSALRPVAMNSGTIVTLRDLFFATPARLKFMRTDRAEAQAIIDTVKRLAMADPSVQITLRDVSGTGGGRDVFSAVQEQGAQSEARHSRLSRILGKAFAENALQINAERDGLHLTGFAALPTYSRGSAVAQYLFVNGRHVKDKLLTGSLRAAYADVLSRDRHPAAALFLRCDPRSVDVNVHPAKTQVRFRNPGVARGLIISALRHALAEAGHRASTTVATATLGSFQPKVTGAPVYQMPHQKAERAAPAADTDHPGFAEIQERWGRIDDINDAAAEDTIQTAEACPLGAARGQVHENYIIAQTETGMVIVDQHAAHERLIYEKLKEQMAQTGVSTQALLIPEIIELSREDRARLLEFAATLAQLGFSIEAFGGNAIAVRETPAILGQVNATALIHDILDELADQDDSSLLKLKINAILSRIACHGSIRAGRRMRAEEMNALLREIEATPHSGQCNHGRPTYVELKLTDIERLFGRT
ncbi:MAG: DNA mismatch repair endonuclease MutL [Pseudomonadota bacterium]